MVEISLEVCGDQATRAYSVSGWSRHQFASFLTQLFNLLEYAAYDRVVNEPTLTSGWRFSNLN